MHTRILIPLLLGVLLVASSTHAQDTLVVSERVGKVLDEQECRYFGLFPGIHRFEGIAFIQQGDSVAIENGGVHYKTIPQSLYEEFTQYIRQYDKLLWSLRMNESLFALNERYKALQHALLTMPVVVWKGADVALEVKGPKYHRVIERRGELIWAGEEMFILLPKGEFDFAKCDTIAPGDLLSVTWYDGNHAWTGAIIGGILGGILGYAAGQGTGGSSNTGYYDPEPIVIAIFTVLGAATVGGLGALVGAISPRSTKTKIEILYDYYSILPQLKARMYYRYGLPPDSPWREK